MTEFEHLKSCRICGVKTEGCGLEGLHSITKVQAWCEKHCLEEFGEHEMWLEDHDMLRYCKRCGREETPEETEEWRRDQEQDWFD